MSDTFAVCLVIDARKHWLIWCSEDSGHDHFIEQEGRLLWSMSRQLLQDHVRATLGIECAIEERPYDFDLMLESLSSNQVDFERAIDIWNLLTDLSVVKGVRKHSLYGADIFGAKAQYERLFARTNAARIVGQKFIPDKIDARVIENVMANGRSMLRARLSNGIEIPLQR